MITIKYSIYLYLTNIEVRLQELLSSYTQNDDVLEYILDYTLLYGFSFTWLSVQSSLPNNGD